MCLALFEALTVFSQNVVNSAYFENNPQIGSDVEILKSVKSVKGLQTFTTFEVRVSESGLYYANFWILGTKLPDGKIATYEILVNGKPQHDNVVPDINDWQAVGTQNKSKLFLHTGVNTITLIGQAPDVPEVEFVRLSKIQNRSIISSSKYDRYKSNIISLSKANASYNLQQRKIKRQISNDNDTIVAPTKMLKSIAYDTPLYDYQYSTHVKIKYTFFKTVSFTQGQQIFVSTNGIDNYEHILEIFSASNPEKHSWSSHSNSNCLASLNIKIPETGIYYVRVRSYLNATSGLANVNINGENYFSNVPLYSIGVVCRLGTDQVYNTFACSTTGDPILWIESYGTPSGIIAFNDDYHGSGNFNWGRWSRISKKFTVPGDAVLLSQYGSSNPEAYCDLYMKCKNSDFNKTGYPDFPNLEEDDAIKSAAASTTYNCISWSGGITQYWEWPPSPLSNFYDADPLKAFDKFYASRGLTRNGATKDNAVVALWAIVNNGNRSYTHASVKNGADINLHGYDWESKPGSLTRTFHPKDALTGDGYGEIVEYYRKDPTSQAKALMSETTENKEKTEVATFTDQEKDVISSKLMQLPSGAESKFNELFSKWYEDIQLSPYSSFEQLGKFESYNSLKQFCQKTELSSFLIYKKLDEGNIFASKLLEDLSIPSHKVLLQKEVKQLRSRTTVLHDSQLISPYYNAIMYAKKLLQEEKINSEQLEKSIYTPDGTIADITINVTANTIVVSYKVTADSPVSIGITDMNGHVVVAQRTLPNNIGEHTISLTVPTSGTYIINYVLNNMAANKKVVIK